MDNHERARWLLGSSRRYLLAARYLLERKHLGRICDESRSAIMWSLEAWFHLGSIKCRTGKMSAISAQFLRMAPEGLRKQVSRCLSDLALLDGTASADALVFQSTPAPGSGQWVTQMDEVLSEIEELISAIERVAEQSACAA